MFLHRLSGVVVSALDWRSNMLGSKSVVLFLLRFSTIHFFACDSWRRVIGSNPAGCQYFCIFRIVIFFENGKLSHVGTPI